MKQYFSALLLFLCFGLSAQSKDSISCEWEMNLTDEFSGKKKMQLKLRKFFSYNPKGSESYFLGKDYLECWGALSKVDNKFLLNLSIIIQDPEISAQMGSMPPNSTLEMTSIQGKSIYLKTFSGAVSALKDNNTIYNCSFFVPKSSLKRLKKFEIAELKINWSKAYQLYTVHYLDFLSNQIKCFE
jgi:hypothetical protein